jgi:hypothetical protein
MNARRQAEIYHLLIRYITEVSRMVPRVDIISVRVPVIFPKSHGEIMMRRVYKIAIEASPGKELTRMLWMHYRHFCELYALAYIEADATDED